MTLNRSLWSSKPRRSCYLIRKKSLIWWDLNFRKSRPNLNSKKLISIIVTSRSSCLRISSVLRRTRYSYSTKLRRSSKMTLNKNLQKLRNSSSWTTISNCLMSNCKLKISAKTRLQRRFSKTWRRCNTKIFIWKKRTICWKTKSITKNWKLKNFKRKLTSF